MVQLDPAFKKPSNSSEKDGVSLGKSAFEPSYPGCLTFSQTEAGAAEALQIEVELGGQLAKMVEQCQPFPDSHETAASFRAR